MSDKRALLIILGLSLLTHFLFFGHPNQTVFDEVHFGKFISGYYTQEYFFDIHPPLGKLIIAGFGKLFDFKPEFSFSTIGDVFPDGKYKALRFLPSLAGSLLPIIMYLLARELDLSKRASFTVGIATALENALITQSRYILLDAFLLLFGFTALWLYLRYRNGGTKRNLFLSGILLALSISVKWTGAAFFGLIVVTELFYAIRDKKLPNFGTKVLALGVVPFALYFSLFALHFSLLTKTGPGDAFMTPGFQKTLIGNNYNSDANVKTPSLWGKFLELNGQMYSSNQRLTATHPYGSEWHSWPFMKRSIFYWVSAEKRIYLIGNPVIWWLSTIGVLTLITFLTTRQLRPDRTNAILLGGYILSLLPFVGVHRVMFLYHYFTSLLFAILIFGYLLDKHFRSKAVFGSFLVASLVAFVFFAPLTYGNLLTAKQYERRVWFESWR